MKTKMVYLTVAVEMNAEADEREVVENCDYFFDSSEIVSAAKEEIFTEDQMIDRNEQTDLGQALHGLGSSNFA